MQYKILLDCPKPSTALSLLEEMKTDEFVGVREGYSETKWLEGYLSELAWRYKNDVPVTAIYAGSTLVGIAFSREVEGKQAEAANLIENSGYWKLGNFFITKSLRGQGLGAKTLEFFIKAKDQKVTYFAEIENLQSNAVAKRCGMIHTHDYIQPKETCEVFAVKIGTRLRMLSWVSNVYFAALPETSMLVNPKIMTHL